MMTVIWVVMAAPLRVSTPVCVVPFHIRVDVTIAPVEALVMDEGTFQRRLSRPCDRRRAGNRAAYRKQGSPRIHPGRLERQELGVLPMTRGGLLHSASGSNELMKELIGRDLVP